VNEFRSRRGGHASLWFDLDGSVSAHAVEWFNGGSAAAKQRARQTEFIPFTFGLGSDHRLAVRAFTSGSGGSGALGNGSYQNVAHDQSSEVSAINGPRPTDLLDRDPGFLLPCNGVGQMPAIHRHEVILRQAAPVVEILHLLNAPAKPHVILASRAAKSSELCVARPM